MNYFDSIIQKISRRGFIKWTSAVFGAAFLARDSKPVTAQTDESIVEELPDEIFMHAPGWHIPR